MNRPTRQSSHALTSPSAGFQVGRSLRRFVHSVFAAGALLSLAVVGGLSFAAAEADATTFPGTNGRVAASGPLNTFATGSQLELFTMRSKYSDPVNQAGDECQLTDNDTNSDFNPRFSKDGKKMAFIRDDNVWTMQTDGRAPDPGSTDDATPPNPCATPGTPYQDPVPGTQKQLTGTTTVDPDGLEKDSFLGGWCTKPNGEEWIIFQRSAGTGRSFEVYKQKVNSDRTPSGAPVPLTTNAANDSQPSVKPECSKVAFHSNRGTTANSNIWVMDFEDANGDGEGDNMAMHQQSSPVAEESAPAYSPDGAQIAFQGDRDVSAPGPLSPRNLEIYRMNADVTTTVAPKRLTYSGPSVNQDVGVINLTGFDLNPAWSPDGQRICFHSGRAQEYRSSNGPLIHGQWEIYTLDAAKGEPVSPNPDTTGSATERNTWRAGNDERCGWQGTPDIGTSDGGGGTVTGTVPGGTAGTGTTTGTTLPGSGATTSAMRAALRRCITRANRLSTRARRRAARIRCERAGRPGGPSASAASRSEIILSFRAPGSVGRGGPPARRYVIKQSTRPIRSERDFGRALTLCGRACALVAQRRGQRLSLKITQLRSKRTYYYAVKAVGAGRRTGPRSETVRARTR